MAGLREAEVLTGCVVRGRKKTAQLLMRTDLQGGGMMGCTGSKEVGEGLELIEALQHCTSPTALKACCPCVQLDGTAVRQTTLPKN